MTAASDLLADASFTEQLNARLAEIREEGRRNVDLSLAERLALCEQAEPGFVDSILDELRPIEWQRAYYDWQLWARKKQLAPTGSWRILFWLAGRGTGKNRSAAEWFVARILSGHTRQGVIVGPTLAEIKRNQIGGLKKRSKGENGSGILDILPPWVECIETKNTGELFFPQFDCRIYSVSAETPDFVGLAPSIVWVDEIVKYPHPEFLLSQIAFSNRERGKLPPQVVITSTPRPKRFLKELVLKQKVRVIHATTWENRGNVSDDWMEEMEGMSEREKAQELEAEILGDNPDALFSASDFDKFRLLDDPPSFDRIVIGVDPSGGNTSKKTDPTGLVAVGLTGAPLSATAECFVLEARNLRELPEAWSDQAFDMAEKHGASAFVIERNYGAEYCAATLRGAAMRKGYELVKKPGHKHLYDLVHPVKKIRLEIIEVTAKGDKAQRANPVAALASEGRIHIVGHMTEFEDELTQWNPKLSLSPGQLDAFVHAVVDLLQLGRVEIPTDHRSNFAALTEARTIVNEQRQPSAAPVGLGTRAPTAGGRGRVAF